MARTTVHFATNREEELRGDEVVGFGRALNPKSPLWLRFGAADMTGPARRSGAYGITELRVAPEAIPGVTEGAAETKLGSQSVFDGLRGRLAQNKADLVLLLHGYACDFGCGLSNAAELKNAYSTKALPLETAVFSWPADGVTVPWISYASDRDDARSSAKAVARALRRIMDYLHRLPQGVWCNQRVHLVAHSMGNYVLRNALQALISDFGARPLPRLFETIFLMAADEDADAFETDKKLARLPELAQSVQVYFASNDRALTISDKTKANPDRLGSTGPRTMTALPQKVTLVDCTQVSGTSGLTDANHQYYRKRTEVIRDVQQVLAGKPPEAVTGREWVPSRNCFRIKPARGR